MIVESTETFTIVATITSTNTLTTTLGATGTILDNDLPPVIPSFTISSVVVNEGSSAVFVVQISVPTTVDTVINITTTTGTAGAADFTSVTTTVTIPAGQTSVTVSVPTVDDNIGESTETFLVTGTSTGTSNTIATGVGTITPNDPVTVTVSNVTVVEGASAVFTVTLSNPSSVATTIVVSTNNGTAVAPGDYTSVSTITVTIPAGATSVNVIVPTIDDTIVESTETFTIVATITSTNTLTTTVGATGTILDNEPIIVVPFLPTVLITSTTVIEGQPASFIISISSPSTVPTVVVVTIQTGGTAGAADYTFTTTTVVIPAGQTSVTVVVATNQDLLVEASETFIVSATVTSTNTANTNVIGVGTILDDDVPPIPPSCEVKVYNALTPDGDGENDYFRIDGLDCYTENTVIIYNRWGILVFERDGYNQSNAFRGDSEGRVNIQQGNGLPEGTYWYILKYKNQSTGDVTEKAGYLYINR